MKIRIKQGWWFGMNKKGLISSVELIVIFLAASIGIVYLNNLAANNLKVQNQYYDNIYNEQLLSAVLNFRSRSLNFNRSNQLELISIYTCNPDAELKDELDTNLKDTLDLLRRSSNANYILYVDGQNDLIVYNDKPNICLDELNPAVFEADTLCGKAKIQLGTWDKTEEVSVC